MLHNLGLCVAISIAFAAAVQVPLFAEDGLAEGRETVRQDHGAVMSWMTTKNDRLIREFRPSVKVKYYTFDDIPVGDAVNKTYTHDGDHWLEFDHFNIFNATEASEKGFIEPMDLDCASTKYNALHNSPHDFITPSVIRSNASSLAAAGFSDLFDVIAWTWKPFGPTSEFPVLSMTLWKIEGKAATVVDGMATGWLWGYDGFSNPSTFVPGDYWPGWGEGGNWIEI